MIYCVVPEALESELYEKLCKYYANDDGVRVIVERRRQERRDGAPSVAGIAEPRPTDAGDSPAEQKPRRELRDRRRQRVAGEFPPLGPT